MFRISTIASLALALLLAFATEDANAQLVQGYPDAIVCDVPEGKVVAYLNQVQKDGTAIFMSQNRQYAKWMKDGTVLRNDKPFPGCKSHSFSK